MSKGSSTKPNYVDLCDEDPPMSGQKFVCVSFISPESVLKRRELFLFEQFVKQWDMNKSMSKFSNFTSFLSTKYGLNSEKVTEDYTEFVKEEELLLKSSSDAVSNDYKNFLDKDEDRLNLVFNKQNNFQTSVRGLKIRGIFPSQDEAEMHCKKLRANDPNHDIYVAPNGVWLPWEPTYYKLGKVDYLEPELNRLHEEKIKNEILAKSEFDQRVKDAKRAAITENVRLAKLSGNKLTQTINDDGDLIGVNNTIDFNERDVATSTGRDAHEKSVFDRSQLS